MGDQSQISDVLDVAGGELPLVAAAQQRLDHPAYPVFLQLVGELVQVGFPIQNKLLLGLDDVAGGD